MKLRALFHPSPGGRMPRTATLVIGGILAVISVAVPPARAGDGRAGLALGGADTLEVATFAGGCFWCMEEAFDAVPGVEATISGYTGGNIEDPGYEQVSSGRTGHLEAVNVFFDPDVVTYAELLQTFWRNVDPTDDGGQFCDRGSQYVSAIFVRNERQRALAEESKRALETGRRIVTPILRATTFWPAEEYHQDYYTKNSVRYRFYKFNCGRKARLEEVWGEAGG